MPVLPVSPRMPDFLSPGDLDSVVMLYEPLG